MDINQIKDRIAAGRMTRRDLNRVLASAGLATIAVPHGPRTARAQGGEAVSFTWAGNDVPELHGEYIAKHGAAPEFSIYADEYEAFAKVNTGYRPDVVQPCSPLVSQWRDAGLIQAIDTSRLSHWPDIFPILKDLPGTQFEGQQWFAPFSWGRTSVTYRTDMVEWEGEDSYGLLWDERFKGKLAVFDSVDETVFTAAIYAGVDPCDMGDAELDKVMALLAEQKSLLRFYATAESDSVQALAAGEIVAALTWDSGAAQLKAQGVPVHFMSPKEGVETWCCGLVLIKDAPHADKAYDLIDALLAPESGEFYISIYGTGHSNRVSFERVSDERLAELQLPRDPSGLLETGVMYCKFKDKDTVIERFEEMQAES